MLAELIKQSSLFLLIYVIQGSDSVTYRFLSVSVVLVVHVPKKFILQSIQFVLYIEYYTAIHHYTISILHAIYFVMYFL